MRASTVVLVLIAAFPLAAVARVVEAVAPGPQDGEIEERSITALGGLDPFDARDVQELVGIFDDAERLFASAQQADSIEVFGGLIARLESDHRAGTLSDELRRVLILSHARRAEAHFNLGETEQAEQDLTAVLAIEPSWAMDPNTVSPKLVELFDRLRKRTVGRLLLQIEPHDAVVLVAGRRLDQASGPQPVLAGEHVLRVARAGFAPLELPIEVPAGESVEVNHELERTSAVLRLTVSPSGVLVFVDDAPARVSRRPLVQGADEESAEISVADIESLEIEGLQPGSHSLSFQLDGFRERRLQVEVDALADYQVAAQELAPSRGEILLSGVPPEGRLTLDGRATDVVRSDTTARLTLLPGNYQLRVVVPGVGAFDRTVRVEDSKVTELAVELEPTIAFLGVLGNDRLAAGSLAKRLAESFQALDSWSFNDRFLDVGELAARLSSDADAFRELRAQSSNQNGDWDPLRQRVTADGEEPLFLLAVLGDDLFATTADLWFWNPAPWPSKPRVLSVSLTEGGNGLSDLMAVFDQPVVTRRASLGMRLVDSALASGPVVSTVVAEGPANSAGIEAGDELVEFGGQAVASSTDLLAFASELAPGATASVRLMGEDGSRETTIEPQEGFELVSLTDPDVVEPVLAAQLSIELHRRDAEFPMWALQLQKAAVFLRASAFDEAVPVLRTISAPEESGLARVTGDYWLGLTLLSIDPRTYADAARAALERVLANPEARLGHDDGPLLAPRARVRLEELEKLTN